MAGMETTLKIIVTKIKMPGFLNDSMEHCSSSLPNWLFLEDAVPKGATYDPIDMTEQQNTSTIVFHLEPKMEFGIISFRENFLCVKIKWQKKDVIIRQTIGDIGSWVLGGYLIKQHTDNTKTKILKQRATIKNPQTIW